IYENWMPNEELAQILKKIEINYEPIAFLMTTENHSCIIKYNRKVRGFFMFVYKLWWLSQFVYREPFIGDNNLFQQELKNGKVFKVMNFIGLRKNKAKISKELNKEFREEFPEIESSWTVKVNELTPKGCNKGNGVEKYCELMNINKNDVYVVGDSGNDITMFEKFHEHSYCMKRGHPSVRKYAKHTISRVYKLEKLIERS
ncbi:MAG: HAD hydrolase family protein, partial [Erysipelotrichaceae bacterium]|nr:HAD hydrolase family protein [Erysipelotrichaceae bacterium]